MSRIHDEIAANYPSLLKWSAHGEERTDSRLMADLASHVVDALEAGDSESVDRAFDFAESLITTGSEAEVRASVVGFLETVQNVASHRKCGGSAFVAFLRPASQQQWAKLDEVWKGKSDPGASCRSRD